MSRKSIPETLQHSVAPAVACKVDMAELASNGVALAASTPRCFSTSVPAGVCTTVTF